MKKGVTNEEILGAINTFASATEERFQAIENRLNTVETNMATKTDLRDLDNRMGQRMAGMKLELIDAMDRKDQRLRGDLTTLIRKQSFRPLNS